MASPSKHALFAKAREAKWMAKRLVPGRRASPFTYQPLDPGLNEIRILEILPTAPLQTLQCTLRHASLDDDNLAFEAMSYCWGDPKAQSLIQVNLYDVYVPRNAELALRRVSLLERPRAVWIDSVCIDQSNKEERSQQVRLMCRIYSLSKMTLVYVGEADEHTDRAIETIEVLAREMESDIGADRSLVDLVWGERIYADAGPTIEICSINLTALKSFYDRAWFRRTWVVQEFALSKTSWLFCGSCSIDMLVVVDVATWLFAYHRKSYRHIELLRSPANLFSYRHNMKLNGGMHMDCLLDQGRNLETTDKRDKVYGMLGMLNTSQSAYSPVPDYNKAPHLVYRDATRVAFQDHQDPFKVLRSVYHRDQVVLQSGLYSSWVPRFDIAFSAVADEPTRFEPRANSTSRGDPNVALCVAGEVADKSILRLQGIAVGQVIEMTAEFDLEHTNSDPFGQFIHHVNEIARRQSHREHTCIHGNLARTLIADDSNVSWHGMHKLFEIYETWPWDLFWRARTDQITIHLLELENAMRKICRKRKLAILSDGSVGLLPKMAHLSDLVVVVHGSVFPLVLRPKGEEYLFLGACYVDQIMPEQERWDAMEQELIADGDRVFNVK